MVLPLFVPTAADTQSQSHVDPFVALFAGKPFNYRRPLPFASSSSSSSSCYLLHASHLLDFRPPSHSFCSSFQFLMGYYITRVYADIYKI